MYARFLRKSGHILKFTKYTGIMRILAPTYIVRTQALLVINTYINNGHQLCLKFYSTLLYTYLIM